MSTGAHARDSLCVRCTDVYMDSTVYSRHTFISVEMHVQSCIAAWLVYLA